MKFTAFPVQIQQHLKDDGSSTFTFLLPGILSYTSLFSQQFLIIQVKVKKIIKRGKKERKKLNIFIFTAVPRHTNWGKKMKGKKEKKKLHIFIFTAAIPHHTCRCQKSHAPLLAHNHNPPDRVVCLNQPPSKHTNLLPQSLKYPEIGDLKTPDLQSKANCIPGSRSRWRGSRWRKGASLWCQGSRLACYLGRTCYLACSW